MVQVSVESLVGQASCVVGDAVRRIDQVSSWETKMSTGTVRLTLEFTSSRAGLEIGREARNRVACICSHFRGSGWEAIRGSVSGRVGTRPGAEVACLIHICEAVRMR